MMKEENKKGKPESIKVEYKGETFTLQPGHKVYECNVVTGTVKEHQLVKKIRLPWQETIYKPVYSADLVHKPAFDIHKAVTDFKHMLKDLIDQRKKEGNPLVIKAAK